MTQSHYLTHSYCKHCGEWQPKTLWCKECGNRVRNRPKNKLTEKSRKTKYAHNERYKRGLP